MMHEDDNMDARSSFKQAMDSSIIKLAQNVLLCVLCYLGNQTMTRLDRLEQASTSAQTLQAVSARDLSDLKADKQARDQELAAVHSQLSDMVSRLAVLESRGVRK